MSNIIEGITKDLKAIPKNLKAKVGDMDTKKLVLLNLPYIFVGYFCDKVAWLWRVSEGTNGVLQSQECQEVPAGCRIRFGKVGCILSTERTVIWTQKEESL